MRRRTKESKSGSLLCAVAAIAAFAALALFGCDPNIRLGAAAVDADQNGATDAPARIDVSESNTKANADEEPMDAAEPVDGLGTVMWSASFETGDFSEYFGDNDDEVQQGCQITVNGTMTVSAEQAHSGTHSAKISISSANGAGPYVYLYRNCANSPNVMPDAYYGAWLYIPIAYHVGNYWNLVHFIVSPNRDRFGSSYAWDVDLQSDDAGDLTLYVFDFIHQRRTDQPNPIAVQPGQWFHLEVFLHLASDTTGRLVVWQNGRLIIDAQNLMTSATQFIQWAFGSASSDITPSPADLYIDDVTVSTARVGP